MGIARRAALSAIAALAASSLGACATTTTNLVQVDPALVRAEETKERELALETNRDVQAHLDELARPLLIAAKPLCGADTAPLLGFRYGTLTDYEKEWRAPAAAALSLTETPKVTSVTSGAAAAAAGLEPGDEIVRVGSIDVPPGKDANKALGEWFEAYRKEGGPAQLSVRRDGNSEKVTITPELGCNYGVFLVRCDLNAYADGENVYVTSSMMRFATDDELAIIIAHEIAHNAMGHIAAKKKNALFGAILGAFGDIAMTASGYNTGGYYAQQGAAYGAMTFSQDFEREADYVGMYILALAGKPLEPAPRFWRHMAMESPEMISFAGSHPSNAERFVRMEHAIAEIEAKEAAGEPLRPEMKKDVARKEH